MCRVSSAGRQRSCVAGGAGGRRRAVRRLAFRAELCYLRSGPALPEPADQNGGPHAALPPLAFMVLMKTTLINSQQSHAPCTPHFLCLLFPYHFKAPHFDFSRVSLSLCFVYQMTAEFINRVLLRLLDCYYVRKFSLNDIKIMLIARRFLLGFASYCLQRKAYSYHCNKKDRYLLE